MSARTRLVIGALLQSSDRLSVNIAVSYGRRDRARATVQQLRAATTIAPETTVIACVQQERKGTRSSDVVVEAFAQGVACLGQHVADFAREVASSR